jgi:hypothetical protein
MDLAEQKKRMMEELNAQMAESAKRGAERRTEQANALSEWTTGVCQERLEGSEPREP